MLFHQVTGKEVTCLTGLQNPAIKTAAIMNVLFVFFGDLAFDSQTYSIKKYNRDFFSH